MGMDMMIAVAREVELQADAFAWCQQERLEGEERTALERAVLHERVDRLAITEDLTGIDCFHDIVDENGTAVDEDDPGYAAALARVIREQLHKAVDVIYTNYREISALVIDDVTWMATGGLSFGDFPTDAYEPINLIDAYAITVTPITRDEIAAARQKVASG